MGLENSPLWDLPEIGNIVAPQRPPFGGGGSPPGMPGSLMSLMLPGIISLLPSIFSGLMGNPMEQRRREAMAAISPEAIQKAQQEATKRLMNSQGFHMANRMAMMGGQGAMNRMSAGLAKNGMGQSGIGSVVPGLGSMAITNQRGNLLAGAEEMGNKEGMDLQRMKFQEMMGYNPGPSRTQSLLAGGLGAFGPYMMDWMRNRYNNPQSRQVA